MVSVSRSLEVDLRVSMAASILGAISSNSMSSMSIMTCRHCRNYRNSMVNYRCSRNYWDGMVNHRSSVGNRGMSIAMSVSKSMARVSGVSGLSVPGV